MTWCKAVGVTSVLEIVSASLSEEFVKELQLKLAPARVLLEALRKGDVVNDGLHVPIEGFSRTATFVRKLQAGQATEQQQEALSALCEYALRVGGDTSRDRVHVSLEGLRKVAQLMTALQAGQAVLPTQQEALSLSA